MRFTTLNYDIYNLPVKIEVADCYSKSLHHILEQFGNYAETEKQEKIRIRLSPEEPPKAILNNPSSHLLIEKGFTIKYPKYFVSYVLKDEILQIQIQFIHQGGAFIRYLKKLNNIQYNSLTERAVQIIWENCLYPAIYFLEDYLLIHSSGFSVNNKEALLLGGTGGVGKTSLELELAKNPKFGFLNDDIAILDTNGLIFPNLSWPKIYAYNIVDNKRVRRMILQGRSIDDRLAYFFRKHTFGPDKVRRTVNPEKLFTKNANHPLALGKFIFLLRGNYSKLKLRKYNPELIPNLNTEIIKSEFSDFEKHLNWHYYNSSLKELDPIIETRYVHQRWNEIQAKIFKNVDCYVMEIPIAIRHNQFMNQASKLIEGLYN